MPDEFIRRKTDSEGWDLAQDEEQVGEAAYDSANDTEDSIWRHNNSSSNKNSSNARKGKRSYLSDSTAESEEAEDRGPFRRFNKELAKAYLSDGHKQSELMEKKFKLTEEALKRKHNQRIKWNIFQVCISLYYHVVSYLVQVALACSALYYYAPNCLVLGIGCWFRLCIVVGKVDEPLTMIFFFFLGLFR